MSKIIEDKIFNYIKTKKIVRTKDIEKKFNLSQATTRRNLINLEKQNLIKRSFGENYIKDENSFEDRFVNLKIQENIKIKQSIAQKAAILANDYKTVFIDSGSLCYYLLDYLNKNISIFTNSLLNASKAISLGFNEVNILGGIIKEKTHSIVDIDDEVINKISFPISFIGVNAIDEFANLYTPEKKEAKTKEKILKNSLYSVVLAEKEKMLGIKSTFNFRPKNTNITIVTDAKIKKLKNNNTLIINV